MANEGQFPKVNGDVLYASEVNKFVGAGYYQGGSFAGIGSSSELQDMGSIVFPVGSLFNPCVIEMDCRSSFTGNPIVFQLSGTSANAECGSIDSFGAGGYQVFKALIGSATQTFSGAIYTSRQGTADNYLYAYADTQGISNLDVTKPVVLKCKVYTETATANIYYVLRVIGRGY